MTEYQIGQKEKWTLSEENEMKMVNIVNALTQRNGYRKDISQCFFCFLVFKGVLYFLIQILLITYHLKNNKINSLIGWKIMLDGH